MEECAVVTETARRRSNVSIQSERAPVDGPSDGSDAMRILSAGMVVGPSGKEEEEEESVGRRISGGRLGDDGKAAGMQREDGQKAAVDDSGASTKKTGLWGVGEGVVDQDRRLHSSHHLVGECGIKEFVNVGEDSEMEVCGYRGNGAKQLLCWALTLLTLGLLRLVFHWRPKWHLQCTHSRCSLDAARRVLLKDQYQQWFVEEVRILKKSSGSESRPSIWARECGGSKDSMEDYFDVMNGSSIRYFKNKKLKYIWNPAGRLFERLKGLEEGVPCAFFHTTSGLSAADEADRRLLYGVNGIIVRVTPVFKLLFTQFLNPFYMFQLFSVTLWFCDEYYYYAACIVLITVISLSAEVVQTRTMQRALKGTVSACEIVSVRRNGGDYVDVLSDQLLPGDVVEVPRHGCVMSCDAVLVSGNCIVNESMLTGESVPVTKTPIPHPGLPGDGGHTDYSLRDHSRHTLFCGSHVIQTRYYGNLKVRAVVLRTGFLTTKGELVRSILFPKPVDFRFTQDAFKFVAILAGFALVGMIYTLVLMVERGDGVSLIVLRTLDIITIVVPPALPAAITAGTVFAQKRLRRQQVYCISPNSINLCGALNVVCFDKTGTLTEDGLDMWGCVPSDMGRFQPELRDARSAGCDPLVIAMATCHSLTIIEGQLVGDPLDLKMFEAVGWDLEEPGDDSTKYDVFLPTVVRPKKPDLVQNSENLHGSEDIPFEVGIVRQFPFSSKLQRMSVIARTLSQNHFDLYVKGSPEMIVSLSVPETVPADFQEVLLKYTLHGYRVIALATRSLNKMTYVKVQRAQRELVECDLTFLGLLVMENRLKKNTTPVIEEMKAAAIRTVMVTGDNILTALSVARECRMIAPADSTLLVDVLPPSDGEEATIRWTYADNTPGGAKGAGGVEFQSIEIESNERLHLALTGKSWALIREYFPQLVPKLAVKGTVFARMSPEQKQQLIETLQEVGYHVGMCGDGANDCGALKTAHAGISLSEAEASVASPFTSKVQDISCVPTVIREGRAALVTSFGIFKYMACYSFTQFTSVCLLYWIGANLTDFTFLYIDLFLLTSLSISFGYTAAYPDLVKQTPPVSLISLPPVISIVVQMGVIITFQVLTWCYVRSQPWYLPFVPNEDEDYASQEVTTVFCVSSFQYITLAIVFAKGAPFRKTLFTNHLFLVNLIVLLAATVYITMYPFEWLSDLLELVLPPSLSFRGQIVGIAAINFLLCYILELFVVGGCERWCAPGAHGRRTATEPRFEEVERQLLTSPILPATSRSTGSVAELLRGDVAAEATTCDVARRNSVVASLDDLRSTGLVRDGGSGGGGGCDGPLTLTGITPDHTTEL